MRRNVPMIYIVENNGCYGLTKGQFSPTADLGSTLKTGVVNDLPAIDLCALAIDLGASFVARSFSGDKKQLLSLLKAAIAHRGTAMLDVISPCVTFNDHEGSTKSYSYVKDHDEPLEEIELRAVLRGHHASTTSRGRRRRWRCTTARRLCLKKLAGDYDPTNKADGPARAARVGRRGASSPPGSSTSSPTRPDFLTLLNMVDEPLATLPPRRCARRGRRSTRS